MFPRWSTTWPSSWSTSPALAAVCPTWSCTRWCSRCWVRGMRSTPKPETWRTWAWGFKVVLHVTSGILSGIWSGILFRHLIWHLVWHFILAFFFWHWIWYFILAFDLAFYSGILSGISFLALDLVFYSGMWFGIWFGILFWHFIWHFILAFSLAFYYGIFIWHFILAFYLAFYLAFRTQFSRRTPIHFCLVQDWVKREAPNIRCILVHALLLCKRAESSRSQKIRFLKQFMHKLVADGGNCSYLNHSVGHPYKYYQHIYYIYNRIL